MVTRLKQAIVAAAAFLLSFPVSEVHAQACVPLQIVGSNERQVEKRVSPPSTGITQNNWNTDFTIPSIGGFRQYVTRIVPRSSGDYQIQMFLKYNNGTADEVFDQTVKLQAGEPFTITGAPRLYTNPYQVNVHVGGLLALGRSYSTTVLGCR